MKICHISTFDGGGAFIAAYRYHEQLLAAGVESSFVVAPKPEPKNIRELYYDTFPASLIGKATNRVNAIARNKRIIKAKKGHYEMFSFPESVFRVENNNHVKKADVVHLHFVSQYVNYPTFFKKIKKPVVWTLHDMNPIMGGFHYDIDYVRNREEFEGVESRLQVRKKELTEKAYLHFTCPSQWMQNKLINSPYSREANSVISYGINLQAYKITERTKAPSSKKKILFVAESFKNYRKGFDLLIDAINVESIKDKVELMALGKLSNADIPGEIPITALGYISEEAEKVKIYNDADVVVIPSREDNFPNIMLEAMACGKPVIAFSNGGMSDVIDNSTNGLLAVSTTKEDLRKEILKFINEEVIFSEIKIRKFAEEHFNIITHANALIELYKSML